MGYVSQRAIAMVVMGTFLMALAVSAITPEMEAELEKRVEEELQKTVDALVDADTFRREYLGYSDPVPAPAVSIDDIQAEVEAKLQQEALTTYPESLKRDYEQQAKREYALYQIGDEITVVTKTGEQYQGRLRERDRYGAVIGLRRVRFDDMTADSGVRFEPDKANNRVARFIATKVQELTEKRENLIRRYRAERLREAFTAAGYIPHLGEWVPLKDYIEQELISHRHQLADRLRPLLRQRIYYRAGYRLYNDVWLTSEQIAKHEELARQASEFPPEFERELDALNAENAGTSGSSTTGGSSIGTQELF